MDKTKILFLIFIVFLIVTPTAVSQQNTNPNHRYIIVDSISIKDSIAKDAEMSYVLTNNFYSFILQIIPYLIALAGVGISAYSIYNQKKISQKQINAETKRKLIDNMIDACNSISKVTFALFEISNDFTVSKAQYDSISEKMKSGEKILTENSDLINKLISDSEFYKNKVENSQDQIFKLLKEFYYSAGSILLYLPHNHIEYRSLKAINDQVKTSLTEYSSIFNLVNAEIEFNKKEKELADKLIDDVRIFMNKIEDLINYERDNIEHII
jgi:hypothetical protein